MLVSPLPRLRAPLSLAREARRRALHHVVFFGSDEVSCATLERLAAMRRRGALARLDVVCPSDRPLGRGRALASLPAKELAVRCVAAGDVASIIEVPPLPPPRAPAAGAAAAAAVASAPAPRRLDLASDAQWPGGLALLSALRADVGVVVSFGYFLPPALLDCFSRGGALNMHPSLLPRHRGAAPVAHTILSGDAETGVSVVDVHRDRFDAGALLRQERGVRVGADEGADALTARLAALGAEAVEAVLLDLDGHTARATQQDERLATRAPKLRPEQALVSAARLGLDLAEPAALSRLVRALAGGIGCHGFIAAPAADGGAAAAPPPRRIKLLDVGPEAAPEPPPASAGPGPAPLPGAFAFDAPRRALLLRCARGWAHVRRLQPEFKAPMRGEDFARGLRGGSAMPRLL
jgi:methionyl-tRNA formyltransferase